MNALTGYPNLGLFSDMNNIEWLKTLSTREKVNALETEMSKQPQVDLEVKNYFAPGVYIRQLTVPKGIALVGKIHKYDQFHFLLSGEMLIIIDDKAEHFKAPCIINSKAGAKRAAYALEDTVWLMVHGTDETNIDKIEDHFIAKTEQEFLNFVNEQKRLPFI